LSDLTDITLEGCTPQIEALREVAADFYTRGWSLGTSGNYSVVLWRAPLRLLITASGRDKGRLTERDFVIVDEAARAIALGPLLPSAETPLHVVVAHRPDIGAVLHTHSVQATVLSKAHFAQGRVEIGGYEMLKGLSGITSHEASVGIPILENTQEIQALSARVAGLLAEGALPYGFLIRAHGLYTWGRDLDEARRHVEILEFLFETLIRHKEYLGE
jgi:methylthioribulose-1-phosphate dehydratase